MTRTRRLIALPLTLAALLAGTAAPAVHAADRIDTVAGSGTGGFDGDGAFAVRALLTSPSDVASLAGDAGYLIADTSNNRIRHVDTAGVITTVAGAGPCCGTVEPYAGSDISATDPTVRFNQPRGVSWYPDGGFLVADTGNNRIRRVSPAGIVSNVAGTGNAGYGTGDGATTVSLRAPGGVAAQPNGTFLIADTGNNRIAFVIPGGLLITVAGSPTTLGLGDGGQARNAGLNAPSRVVPLTGGGYLIGDTGNNRIRRVGADGIITTVAGSSAIAGFGGDGGPATQARLNQPEGVAVRDDGSIVIADTGNERIRQVGADGVISTIAGTGTLGLSGDGGPPDVAQLSHPRAVALDGTRVRIADSFNHRVRAITPIPDTPPTTTTTPRVDPLPTRQLPPGVAPPLIGRSSVVTPVSGTILIRLPGTRRFVELESISNIPLGSELDARSGRVKLLFTTTPTGTRASAVVTGGRFVVRQGSVLDLGQRPGTLVLSGPLYGCTTTSVRRAKPARPRAAAAKKAMKAKKKGRKGRRLDVDADGRIRTQGRYGAAIVRGTRWTIVDRCPRDPHPGTFVKVSRGKVAVTAFRLRRTVLVPAGRSFLAPARARARRR